MPLLVFMRPFVEPLRIVPSVVRMVPSPLRIVPLSMVPVPVRMLPGVVCMLPGVVCIVPLVLGVVCMVPLLPGVCMPPAGVVWAKAAVFSPAANTRARVVLKVFMEVSVGRVGENKSGLTLKPLSAALYGVLTEYS